MSKEKIKEMAKVMANGRFVEPNNNQIRLFIGEAENLYNAGYRKQIKGEWKQTEEPMGWHDVDCVECSACGESWVLNDNLDFDLIVEYWHYCPNCGAKMKGEQ
jgi:hypothetical protein